MKEKQSPLPGRLYQWAAAFFMLFVCSLSEMAAANIDSNLIFQLNFDAFNQFNAASGSPVVNADGVILSNNRFNWAQEAAQFDGGAFLALQGMKVAPDVNTFSTWIYLDRYHDGSLWGRGRQGGVANFEIAVTEAGKVVVRTPTEPPATGTEMRDGIWYRTYPTNSVLDLNRWYHLVVTFQLTPSGNNIRIQFYINGKRDVSQTQDISIAETKIDDDNNSIVYIGTDFHGKLDDLRTYDRVFEKNDAYELFRYSEDYMPDDYVLSRNANQNDNGTSSGCAWGDLNGDGWMDLFVTDDYSYYPNSYFDNIAGNRLQPGFEALLRIYGPESMACSWGDVDNDGDADLFVANRSASNYLYINQAGQTIESLTGKTVVQDHASSTAGAWADYDRDGFLDLFVANQDGENNLLYQNKGDGGLRRINDSILTQDGGDSRACAWGDYDMDGWPDLFVANGEDQNNFLYHNQGDGTFEKVRVMDVIADGGSSLGGSWGDYDNDGDLDLFVCNSSPENFLYQNDGGVLNRVPLEALGSDYQTFGSSWGDYNNDGRLDLVMAHRHWSPVLYTNEGNGYTQTLLAEPGSTPAVANSDYNHDGVLDLFVCYDGFDDVLMTGTPNGNHWLKVACEGVQSNRSAIGARVRVKADCGFGPMWQMREISSQTGGRSQNAMVNHFGLGSAVMVDSLRIEWPNGIVWDTSAVAVDQLLAIAEHENVPVPPEAVEDTVQIFSGGAVQICPLENDCANAPGDLILTVLDGPYHGQMTLFNDSEILYRNEELFTGTDTIVYAIENTKGLSDTSQILIYVRLNPFTLKPLAMPDSVLVNVNEWVEIYPLRNDLANNGQALIIEELILNAGQGNVMIKNDSTLMYTAGDAAGEDRFQYVAGNGSGLTDTTDVIVIVQSVSAAEHAGILPLQYALAQNFPNPFNPETTFCYTLEKSGQVHIGIYNALGREVALLVNEVQSAGQYQITWHAGGSAGHNLPTGIYFVQMKAGKFKAMRKMLYTR